MAISRQKEAWSRHYALLLFEWLQGFFKVPSTIGGIVHSKPLNSLEHLMHNHYDKYPARQEF